jgi:hypothetical protein
MSMTAAIPSSSGTIIARWVGEAFRREPLFAGTAFLLAVLMAPLLVAQAMDTRELMGVSVWTKPIKFSVALIVYLGTLAWFAGWLPQGMTQRPRYRLFSIIIVACAIAEMVWIVGAAAAGTTSHFNTTVPLLVVIYPVMGLLATILTAASLVYGIAIWRDHANPLNPAFRLSVAIGLVMTFAATLLAAGVLASGTSHFVGGSGTDAGGLALMGWSRTGGDLRVAHFFATHALHALPLAGLVLTPWGETRWARLVVWVAAAAYAMLITYCLFTALMGQPFLYGIGG